MTDHVKTEKCCFFNSCFNWYVKWVCHIYFMNYCSLIWSIRSPDLPQLVGLHLFQTCNVCPLYIFAFDLFQNILTFNCHIKESTSGRFLFFNLLSQVLHKVLFRKWIGEPIHNQEYKIFDSSDEIYTLKTLELPHFIIQKSV